MILLLIMVISFASELSFMELQWHWTIAVEACI